MTNTQPTADLTPGLPYDLADDRPRFVFHLSVTESTGPHADDRGYEYGQECPGCDQRPEPGEQILRFGDQWWHLTCTRKRMRNGGATEAWLMLGADLAARPSLYSVAETRAIVRNLLRLTVSSTVES